MFGPHPDEPLEHQTQGVLARTYYAHGDPSKSLANFGFGIAHREDRDGMPIVVFDVLHVWRPGDFPTRQIDYLKVEDDIRGYIDGFNLYQLTFDQFSSAPIMAHLRAYADARGRPRRTIIDERTASGGRNHAVAEAFKTALAMGLVWAPPYAQARMELEYLQEINGRVRAPTTGPCRTDDMFDVMSTLTPELLGDKEHILNLLSNFRLVGAMPGGIGASTADGDPDVAGMFRGSQRGPSFSHGAARGRRPDPSRGRR